MKKLLVLIFLFISMTIFANLNDSNSASFFIDVLNNNINQYSIRGPEIPKYQSVGMISWAKDQQSVDLNISYYKLNVKPPTWLSQAGFCEDQFQYSRSPLFNRYTAHIEITDNLGRDQIFAIDIGENFFSILPLTIMDIEMVKDINGKGGYDIVKSQCGRYYIRLW